MVINDFMRDFKALCSRSGLTQDKIAAKMGIQRPNLGRVFKGKIIPEKFEKACEAMGYDIKVVYVPREVTDDERVV